MRDRFPVALGCKYLVAALVRVERAVIQDLRRSAGHAARAGPMSGQVSRINGVGRRACSDRSRGCGCARILRRSGRRGVRGVRDGRPGCGNRCLFGTSTSTSTGVAVAMPVTASAVLRTAVVVATSAPVPVVWLD